MKREHQFLLGLIGTGVTPSLTPPLHMHEARALGLSYVYRPIDLTTLELDPQELPAILNWAERFGFDAVNITHPCKRAVLEHLDQIDPVAAALGSVNTVRFTTEGRIGHNTDTTGFERAFRTGLPAAPTGHVLMIGAGGAGSAVADALLRIGTETLTIVDIDRDRAHELAGELAGRHPATVTGASIEDLPQLIATADGVVQCTPIGMHHHPGTPFDPALLHPTQWVSDIVYRPLETELLTAARAIGCRTLNGGLMAVGQAADTFRLVTGITPDISRMQQHFETLITADECRTERTTS